MSKQDFTQFVHEFQRRGVTRYAVGCWDHDSGQYFRPFDTTEATTTGCFGEFARKPSGMQSFPTKRQALRRARYLFKKE